MILTLNEEANLAHSLASVCDWAREVFVVDAGSSDGTREIAASYGAIVVEHPFETHASQWRWAFANLSMTGEWVLALDADQRVTPELAQELRNLDWTAIEHVEGMFIKRQQWFRGRWIKHGGYYPKYLLKLFRASKVIIDSSDLVDHHFYVAGAVTKLRHDLVEANAKEDDISFWIDKHNRYATLLAKEELRSRETSREAAIAPAILGNPNQRSLAHKRLWRRMPLYIRPFLYFFYRYVIRLGFLDGKQGAIFHFMQAFWFRLLVDINIDALSGTKDHAVEDAGLLVPTGPKRIQVPSRTPGPNNV